MRRGKQGGSTNVGRSKWQSYGLGAGLGLAAVALRLAMTPILGPLHPYAFFYVAVACAAWFAGLGPAVLAWAVGLVGGLYFIEPQWVLKPADLVSTLTYTAVSGCFIALLRRARRSELAALEGTHRAMGAEGQVESERARLEAVLEACPAGLVVADAAGKVLRRNTANQRLWGDARLFRGTEEYGQWKGWWSDGEPVAPQEWALARALRGEVVLGDLVEIEPFDAPGTRRTIINSGAPVCDRAGKVIGGVSAQIDITDVKRAERAVRETSERLQRIIDSAMDAVISVESGERIVLFNAAAEEMFRCSAEEALGGPLHRFIPPEENGNGGHGPRAGSVSNRTVGRLGPMHAVRSNGERFPIEASMSQVEVGGRKLSTVILREITERMRAENALNAAQEELQAHAAALEKTVEERTAELRESLAHLETFSYSITHDLRAPLRTMSSFATLLREEHGPQLDDAGRGYLDRIIGAAGRMDTLIRDVLQYSRVTSGTVNLERVDLEKLVRDVVLHYPNLAEQQERIHMDGLGRDAWVKANAAGLSQVVSNLISNALKFVPPERTPDVRITCERNNGWVRLTVADNGVGIAPEHREKIFGLFQRLHSQEQYAGSGVGLAIVRKSVERMGGRMGVESEPGIGSQFWFELPAAVPRHAAE